MNAYDRARGDNNTVLLRRISDVIGKPVISKVNSTAGELD